MSIVRYTGERFETQVPVCVVGAGACGLTAGISAAHAGAQVVIFERDQTPSGSTAMTIGLICAAGTEAQKELGISDDANSLYRDIMSATDAQTDPTIARLMADESGPTMDWLCMDVGCDFHLATNWKGYGHSALRCHGTPNGTGEEIIAMLMHAVSELDIDVVTQSTVRDLVVDQHSIVRGVICETPDGDFSLGCDALVLACSGFGANRDLVSRFIPNMRNATYHGNENHRGDAVLWGESLGADLMDMSAYQGVGTHTPLGFGLPHTVMMEGGIKVNANGVRFENELQNLSRQAVELMAQPGGVAWILYDLRIHEKASSLFAEYRRNAALIKQNYQADSIDGLAAIIGVAPSSVEETLAVLGSAHKGPFGRVFRAEQRLIPPYFAVKVTGAIYHTQGGLSIDQTARVKRATGGVFPNLFAGGGAARSVSGPNEMGYLPAMGLATAVVFGRIAGKEAAAQARCADSKKATNSALRQNNPANSE